MTPARAELENIVGSLRRKQLLAVMVAALVEMMLAAALLYALLTVGLPNLVLSMPRRLVLALGLVLVFIAALMLEQARQARSSMYLAKRIDAENDLGDHLVSAISFPDPTPLPFEQACINALILRLRQQQLRIPDVRLERLWLIVPALVIAFATGAVEYRRRHRPTDDGALQVTLPESLRDRVASIGTAESTVAGKIDPTLLKQSEEARQMLGRLIERTATKESVLKELSQARDSLGNYAKDNPSVIDAAMQLGDPATQRAGQLLSALRSGQGTAVNEALKSLIDALSGRQPPPLNDEERAEVASILKQIAQATHDKGLSAQLDKAGDAVQNQPTGPDAARPLEELRNPLVARVERERAEKMLISTIRAALADVARKAEMQTRPMLVPSAGADPTTSDDGGTSAMGQRLASPDDEEPPSAADDPEARGQGGNGAGTATASQLGGGTAEKPNTGRDERVTAPWVGAAVSQLVSAGSSGDEKARDAGRELLGAQQRALEQDVRREEIPAEYAQAIRRYFFNVQKDWERQWKSTK